MNIQSGKRSPRRAAPVSGGSGALAGKITAGFKLLLIVAAAAGICNSYIYLNQRIAETDREIRRTRVEIDQVGRELVLLRNRCETLSSWSNISARIRHFNLGLRAAEPGQERTIALLTPAQAAAVRWNNVAMNNSGAAAAGAAGSVRRRQR